MQRIKLFRKIILIYLLPLSSFAQLKEISIGPVFEEPESGYAKIVEMKNGNTFYIHITPKDGINIRIYDPNHKEKVVSNFIPAFGELGKFDEVEAVFEQNNNILLFVNWAEDFYPSLIRITIDGNSGRIKQEKIIASLKTQWKPSAWVNYDPPHFFLVRTDTKSGNYAIGVRHNSRTVYTKKDDVLKPAEIIHFGNNNTELYRKDILFQNSSNIRCTLNDFVVVGEKVFAYTTNSMANYKHDHYLTTIDKAGYQFKKIDILDKVSIEYSIFRYNASADNFVFLIAEYIESKREKKYGILLFLVEHSGEGRKIPDFGISEQTQEEYTSSIEKKEVFQGMIQDLVINDDSSFTVFYEEMMAIRNDSGNGTELGVVVASTYSHDGKRLSEYLVPKMHFTINTLLRPLYLYYREFAAPSLFKGNQYKSFVYARGNTQQYIFFNDTERNNDLKKNKLTTRTGAFSTTKLVRVQGLTGDCDAFMYPLIGNESIPERNYLFGEKDKGHALALLTVSAQSKQNNSFVTLMLDKKNMRSKMVNLVWLELK